MILDVERRPAGHGQPGQLAGEQVQQPPAGLVQGHGFELSLQQRSGRVAGAEGNLHGGAAVLKAAPRAVLALDEQGHGAVALPNRRQIALGADGPRLGDRDDGQAGNLPAGRAKHLGIIELEGECSNVRSRLTKSGTATTCLTPPRTDGWHAAVSSARVVTIRSRAPRHAGYVLEALLQGENRRRQAERPAPRGQQHQEVGPFDPADAAAV